MGYKKIYVIGHSMGGVLATHAAIKHIEVKKLVLVAPAFSYLSTNGENFIAKALKNGPEIIKRYQAKEVFSRFLKVSVTQLREFMKLVELSQANPSMLNVPTLIIQGLDDSIVPHESSEHIFEEIHSPKWLIEIAGGSHDIFRDDKVNEVDEEICKFLKKRNYHAEAKRKW